MKTPESDSVIQGVDIDKINRVFKQYLTLVSPPLSAELTQPKYYTFSIVKADDQTKISITYNAELILKQLNIRPKGGGGDFVINQNGEIVSYTLNK